MAFEPISLQNIIYRDGKSLEEQIQEAITEVIVDINSKGFPAGGKCEITTKIVIAPTKDNPEWVVIGTTVTTKKPARPTVLVAANDGLNILVDSSSSDARQTGLEFETDELRGRVEMKNKAQ